jgi:membrane protein implicated in regulation of membrane protease activity
MQALFGTAPLGPFEWAFLASLAVTIVFVEEIRKWFTRRLTK